MNKAQPARTQLESLMSLLGSKDGVIRQRSRESLVALGKNAVPGLIEAMRNSKRVQVRWEAAKALVALGDASSIQPFVKALEDRDSDVAWLAAEGLMTFKKAAWRPLLEALIERGSKAVHLCQGAHHIFRNQKERGFNDLLTVLEEALEFSAGSESMAVAAYAILKRMKVTT